MTPEQTVRLDRVKRALPPEMGATDFVVEEDGKITRLPAEEYAKRLFGCTSAPQTRRRTGPSP